MFRTYLLPAWRNLTRNKMYALINLSGLAIGICACIIIYIVAGYEFSFDDFPPAGDRIYRLGARIQEDQGNSFASEGYGENIPPPALAACRQEIPGFETIAGFYSYPADVTVPASADVTAAPSGTTAAITPGRFPFKPGNTQPTTIIADTAYFEIFK